MTTRKKRTDQSVNLTIGGNVVEGQIAVGSNISMRKSVRGDRAEALPMLMEALKAQVQNEAPPDLQAEALEKLSVLAASITLPTPNVAVMAQVRDWFAEYIPALSEAVTKLIADPLVVKLMQTAGEETAKEIKRRF